MIAFFISFRDHKMDKICFFGSNKKRDFFKFFCVEKISDKKSNFAFGLRNNCFYQNCIFCSIKIFKIIQDIFDNNYLEPKFTYRDQWIPV